MFSRSNSFFKNLPIIFQKYNEVYNKIIEKSSAKTFHQLSSSNLKSLFTKLANIIAQSPNLIIKYQIKFTKLQLELCTNFLSDEFSKNQTINNDRRFKNILWEEHYSFLWLKNSYFNLLLCLKEGLSEITQDKFTSNEIKKINFFAQYFLDALSPSNFLYTNPEVIQNLILSEGQSIIDGLNNLFRDIDNSANLFLIKNNDKSEFKLGKNIASTPGKVVFKNELFELINYSSSMSKQFSIPILIVPPIINKFYIFDLQEKNSFVKWLIDKNYNVYIISWINPDNSLANKDYSDYVYNGIIEAIKYIVSRNHKTKINTLGYCIGGTLLATAIAYLNKVNLDYINSSTYLATLIDFEDAGDLALFIDEESIDYTKSYMNSMGGFLEGKDLNAVFNLLRPNDLIWPFYINNYLLGREPFPFDILYWNEDSTRIPFAFHSYFLENMYKNNNLIKPNTIKINGLCINVSDTNIPTFVVGALTDHIVPSNCAFNSAKHFGKETEFILTDSGHVSGIINPPIKNKYKFWTNPDFNTYTNLDDWKNHTTQKEGSWWDYWEEWLRNYSGKLSKPISTKIIDENIYVDAPGEYIKIRY